MGDRSYDPEPASPAENSAGPVFMEYDILREGRCFYAKMELETPGKRERHLSGLSCFFGNRRVFFRIEIGNDTDSDIDPDTDQYEQSCTEQEIQYGKRIYSQEKCQKEHDEKNGYGSNSEYHVPDLVRCPESVAHEFSTIRF
jgi:hypothetical protein